MIINPYIFGLVNPVLPPEPLPITDGLRLWLEAGQLANTGDGQIVSGTWDDLSGRANHVSLVNGRTGAIYRQAKPGFNGKPSLEFTGAANYKSLSTELDFATEVSSNWTIFAVISGSTQSAGAGMIWAFGEVALQKRHALSQSGSQFMEFSSPDLTTKTVVFDAKPHICVIRRNSPSLLLRGDREIRNSFTTNPTFLASVYNGFSVGSNTDNTEAYSRDLGELIVYNRSLTDTELIEVENYLSRKYLIPVAVIEDEFQNTSKIESFTANVVFDFAEQPVTNETGTKAGEAFRNTNAEGRIVYSVTNPQEITLTYGYFATGNNFKPHVESFNGSVWSVVSESFDVFLENGQSGWTVRKKQCLISTSGITKIALVFPANQEEWSIRFGHLLVKGTVA